VTVFVEQKKARFVARLHDADVAPGIWSRVSFFILAVSAAVTQALCLPTQSFDVRPLP
jgi:hypothetical protein